MRKNLSACWRRFVGTWAFMLSCIAVVLFVRGDVVLGVWMALGIVMAIFAARYQRQEAISAIGKVALDEMRRVGEKQAAFVADLGAILDRAVHPPLDDMERR